MKKRLLSTLLALCLMLGSLPGTALAATVALGKCGTNVAWTLDSSGTLTINGTGKMNNYSNPDKKTPWWEKRLDIQKVIIQKGVTSIGEGAFEGCGRIGSVAIPDSVTSIGDSAFSHCDSLSSVTIPNSVTSIGNWAFMSCDNLTSVKVPASVTKIKTGAFDACERLSAITVDSANTSYKAVNGVLFTKDMKQLVSYPAGKSGSSYAIPGGVTSIKDDAFYYCKSLSSVTIPNGVTSIGERAFESCSSLSNIAIPNSMTFIGNGAFESCYNLKDVYYSGSKTQWQKIDIINGVSMNGPLLKANIHYNSTGGSTSLAKPTVKVSPGKTVTEGTTVTATWNSISGATQYYTNLWNIDKSEQVAVTVITRPSGGSPSPKYVIGNKLAPGRYRVEIYAQDDNGNKGETGSTTFTVTKKSTSTKTYTIKLDANGGRVSKPSVKVAAGKAYLSSLPTPTRSGWKFAGWYTTMAGGAKITSTTKATASRTIYAGWTRDTTYTVVFDGNGGIVDQDRKIVRTGSLYGELPTPTQYGYFFKGWYTKKTGGVKVTEKTRVNLKANQTLYAQWQSSATVKNTQRGTYRITVPAYYRLALYADRLSAQITELSEKSTYQTITCTEKVTLSNGTVRYYGKVNNRNYWFTYSCEMEM